MSDSQQPLQMGLGKAIGRLNTLQSIINSGTATEDIRIEYKMILDALNVITLQLGFDCDGDGAPDTVDIFKQSVNTGCCRLIDIPEQVPNREGMSSSRRSRER